MKEIPFHIKFESSFFFLTLILYVLPVHSINKHTHHQHIPLTELMEYIKASTGDWYLFSKRKKKGIKENWILESKLWCSLISVIILLMKSNLHWEKRFEYVLIVGHRSKGKLTHGVRRFKTKKEFRKLTGYPDIAKNKNKNKTKTNKKKQICTESEINTARTWKNSIV